MEVVAAVAAIVAWVAMIVAVRIWAGRRRTATKWTMTALFVALVAVGISITGAADTVRDAAAVIGSTVMVIGAGGVVGVAPTLWPAAAPSGLPGPD